MTDARVEDSGEYECQVAHHGDMEEEMGMTFSVHVLGEILSVLRRSRSSTPISPCLSACMEVAFSP